MLAIPELTKADVVFGNISHMPRYSDVPDEFKDRGNPFERAIGSWFFSGASGIKNGIRIDGHDFTAKEGVNCAQALGAIKAVLCSFEPKHEHKTAACAFMLSQWFDRSDEQG